MKSSISILRFKYFKYFALSFSLILIMRAQIVMADIAADTAVEQLGDEYASTPKAPSARETEQITQTTGMITEMSAAQVQLKGDLAMQSSAACQKMLASLQYCKMSAMGAKAACIGVSSPFVLKGIAMVNGLTAAVGYSKSATDVCQKVDKTMKDVQKVMTAYNAACGGAMMACDKTCPTLATDIAACSAQMSTVGVAATGGVPAAATARMNTLASLSKTVAAQVKYCSADYKWNLGSAMAGLLTTMNAQKSASGCKDATTTENNQNLVDCSDPKNKSNTTCICMRNPGTAGCGNANLFAGTPTVGAAGGSGNDGSNLTLPTGDGSSGGDGANPLAALGKSSSGSGGGNSLAPGSGGGGSGGLCGSGSGVDGKEKTTGTKGLNTNILSGTDGGGGGGSRGFSGSSSYQAYLPGGEKDPSRGVASQAPAAALAAQVSAAGSKSNWEKVNDRYREAKSSLVPGP